MSAASTINNLDISNSHNPISVETSEDGFCPVRPEKALWKAVITQALTDAANQSRKAEAVKEKKQAIKWLFNNNEDFIIVCENAGLNPSYVRKCALDAVKSGFIWRNGMPFRHLYYKPSFKKILSISCQAPEFHAVFC